MFLKRRFVICTCTSILIVGVTLILGRNVSVPACHQNSNQKKPIVR